MNVQCCFDLHYKKQYCYLSILIIHAKKKCIRGPWVTFIVNIIISSIVVVGADVKSDQQRIDVCFQKYKVHVNQKTQKLVLEPLKIAGKVLEHRNTDRNFVVEFDT